MMRFKFEFANDNSMCSVKSKIDDTYLLDEWDILKTQLCAFLKQAGFINPDQTMIFVNEGTWNDSIKEVQADLTENRPINCSESIQFQYKGMSATVERKSDNNENFDHDDPCYIGTLNTGNYDQVYFHGDSLDAVWDSFKSCVDWYTSIDKEAL